MIECKKCVLPETYPGISFDENGVCNFCNRYDGEEEEKELHRARFNNEEEVLKALEKYKKNDNKYDVLVPLSGGVDSCFTLIQIVEKFGLRPLVFHSDHGWDDPQATKNVENLCKELDVDLLIWKNDLKFMRRLFKYFNEAEEPSVSACFACGNMLYLNGLELAENFGIKLVINGYSKGQAAMMHDMEKARDWFGKMNDILLQRGDMEFFQKFSKKWEMLSKQIIYQTRQDLENDVNPNKILFVPFFVFKFYQTDKATLEKICRDRFNWKPIKTSYPSRTTNCDMIWLNSYRDLNFRCYTHYHDEYSTLIRAGEFSKEQAQKDLELNPPEGLLERLADEVDINLHDLDERAKRVRENRIAPAEKKQLIHKKILLVMLPFWAPLIPPMGIANLKTFLEENGYDVMAVDGNVEEKFRDFSSKYFDMLKGSVPPENWRNFYVVGKDVLQNHMMAHFHYTDKDKYRELVKILVNRTFYCDIDDNLANALINMVAVFYGDLDIWFKLLLEKECPEVVGFSAFESTLPASLYAAKLTKKWNSDIKILLGGGVFSEQLADGSPNWEYFLEKTPYIDAYIIGEGEQLMLDYLEGRLPTDRRIFTIKDLENGTRDLAEVKLPDYTNFDMAQYPFTPAYTSRSCPFQCSFCSETVHYGKYRKKKAPQIVAEMKELYKRHGRQLFLMCDSLLNPVVTDLANEFIKSDQLMYWDGYLRADKEVCNKDNTMLWRKGGFYKAKLGIESGSPKILELMDKKITPQQVRDAVSSLAYAGIKTSACWVIGHPEETEEDFQMTLDLLEELKDDIYEVWCSPFYYYPSAQANMENWQDDTYLLYPAESKEMLLLQAWYPHCQPTREESYKRMSRFVEHCEKLGIPNPYTMHDLFNADQRWKQLHENSVPSIMEFESKGTYIDDRDKVKKRVAAKSTADDDGDFGF